MRMSRSPRRRDVTTPIRRGSTGSGRLRSMATTLGRQPSLELFERRLPCASPAGSTASQTADIRLSPVC
jgi:hypothetical protein